MFDESLIYVKNQQDVNLLGSIFFIQCSMLILLYYELGIDVVNRKLSESFSNQGGASSIDLYVSSSFTSVDTQHHIIHIS